MHKADKSTIHEFFYKSAVLSEELEKSLKREQILLEYCNEHLDEKTIEAVQRDYKEANSILNNWLYFAKHRVLKRIFHFTA